MLRVRGSWHTCVHIIQGDSGSSGVLTPEGHAIVCNDRYLDGQAVYEGRLRSKSQQAQMNQYAFPAGCFREQGCCQPWGTLTLAAESQALGPSCGGRGLKGMGEAEEDP